MPALLTLADLLKDITREKFHVFTVTIFNGFQKSIFADVLVEIAQILANNQVFEWGSGGSTLFLSKRFNSVSSIEHEPKWLEKVDAEIKKQSLTSVSLQLSSINLDNQHSFEECSYFHSLDKEFDVIIVDGEDHFGPDSTWSARVSC